MELSGKLDELKPPEIFQLISLTRKSGKLVLRSGERQGVVVFRDGRVVFATSDSLHMAIDSVLAEKLVGAANVMSSEVRSNSPKKKMTDSGSFVVAVRGAETGALESLIRRQIEKTVRELVAWCTGTFVFESIALPEGSHISLESGWLEPGVDSDSLILRALTRLDESDRDRWQKDLDKAAKEPQDEVRNLRRKSDISAAFEVLVDEKTGEISWAPVGCSGPSGKPRRDLEKLRSITGEMAGINGISPSMTAELALLILRYAAQVSSRGVLFAVRRHRAWGMGQFGLQIEDESADECVRSLEIPLSEPSVIESAFKTGQTFRGRPGDGPWDAYLLNRLGREKPGDVAVLPLLVEGEVICLLYCDNLPDRSVMGAVDGIEILMQEIGLAVEKARLQSQLSALKNRT